MSADLKETLEEMGGAADFAAALRGAPVCRVDAEFAARVRAAVRESARFEAAFRRRAWWAAAAAAAALIAVSSAFLRADRPRCAAARPSSLAPHVQAFVVKALAREAADAAALRMAVDELVTSQSAEGGWTNPEMSARNVAALAAAVSAGVGSAKVALRRGRRYLRANGIPELDAAAFELEARRVRERFGG